MESQVFDPRKIAESLEKGFSESTQKSFEKAQNFFSELPEEPILPMITPKTLGIAVVKGAEILASRREMARKAKQFDRFSKKSKKSLKRIPFSEVSLDTFLRNMPQKTTSNLKPKHLPLIRAFLFDSLSPEEISIKFNVSRSAVYQILSSPIVKDMINRNKERLSTEYEALGEKVIGNLREFLDDKDKEIRLKTTLQLAKKASFTPNTETLHTVKGTGEHGEILVDFRERLLKEAKVSDEVIDAEFRRLSENE